MSDIVTRLRTRNGRPDGFGLGPVCDEAADTIERMRSALRVIHTWASFDVKNFSGHAMTLDPAQTRDLCAKALEIEP